MIYQYIKELIENNNRIIIPDFGAFMIQSSPEGKQISFNDFLKFNDGLLINQIIKSEKISKAQATDAVKAFISDIEKAFSQNKAFEIKEVGFLVKDEHGNIKFSNSIEQSTLAAATETATEDKPAEKSETPATDSTPTIELAEEKEEEAPKAPEKPIEEKAKGIEETKTEPKEELIPEEKTDIKPIEAEKPKVVIPPRTVSKPIENKPIPAKPIPAKPKTAISVTEKPKVGTTKQPAKSSGASNGGNKSTLVIIIIAVLLIGIFGTGYFLGWFEKKVETVVEKSPTIVVDTVVEEPTPVMEEPKVIEEPDHDPNAKKYYVIAGSFKVPSNAEAFQQKLMNDGFDSEIIVRNNGFHTVSYKTLYDWQEALSEWRNMRANNEQTWILIR